MDPRYSDFVTGDSKPPPEGAPPNQKTEFLKAALAKIKANLELLLGRPVGIAASDPSSAAGSEVTARLPARFVALGVQASGTVDGQIHCVVGQPLVLAMTCIAQLKSEQAIVERLGEAPELSDTEREGAKEVGSFITAALGDFAKESTGGRILLAAMEPRFVPGDEAPDFSGADGWAVIEATVELAPAPAAAILLIVPSKVVAAWKGPEPASVFGSRAPVASAAAPDKGAPSRATPAPASEAAPSAWVAGSEAFMIAIQAAAGEALAIHSMPSLAQLLAAGESEPTPALVVVEVPAGAEFQLEMVAALRHHPTFAASALVVALEDASRRHVVRCGSLGILDVIPVDLDPKTLGERLLSRVKRLPAAAKR